jgi:hypothetical protein
LRRTFPLLLGLLAAGSVAASARPPSDERTSAFERDGVRFEVRARLEPGAGAAAPAARVEVLRAGRPLRPRKPEAALLLGVGGDGAFEVRAFPEDGAPCGWMLETAAADAAAPRAVLLVVAPVDPAAQAVFDTCAFEAHGRPAVRRAEESVEVWSRRRWWRSTAPGASVLVPEVRLVARGTVRDGVLDPDWSRWPEGFAHPSFPSAFSAGLLQENPDLMERALDRLLSPEDLPTCEALGYSPIPSALAEVVCAVDRLALARRHLVRLTEPLSVTPPPHSASGDVEK